MDKKMTNGELAARSHEELCRLVEEGRISWSQWIDAQPESYAGYDAWLKENGYSRSDNAACMYISLCEKRLMDGEASDALMQGTENMEVLRKTAGMFSHE